MGSGGFPPQPGHAGYAFAGFRLDLERGALLRGEADLKLRPKSYEVLCYLVAHHGCLVSKADLLSAVWGRTVVTDDSLTQCLVEIRRAIGDEARCIIRTVPRRGYLLDVPVTPLAAADRVGAAAPRPAGGQPAGEASRAATAPRFSLSPAAMLALSVLILALAWWALALRDAAAPVRSAVDAPALPNSIAVLPFVDMSAESDQEYFGDGIAEEILNLLVQSPELKVIARTSSFSFKNQSADIGTISRRLGVGHVLEGSVRKTGNSLRITAQLIAAQDGTHLWSHSYDREFSDLLGVQREIADAVADTLKTSLLGDDDSTLAPAIDFRAYDHFLRGRFFVHRREPGDLERAREQFEAAVAVEPGYARAWADLSGVYNAQIDIGEIARDLGALRRRAAAEQALALDPDLPEAHLRAIAVFLHDGDLERARHHWRLAGALDPDNALLLGFTSGGLAANGRIDEAIQLWDRIVATDPLSRVSRHNRAMHLMGAGRLEDAKTDLLAARDLGNGEQDDALLALIFILEQRYEEALALLDPVSTSYDRDIGLALAHYALGDDDKADAVVARLQADATGRGALALAQIQAYLGEQEEAFSWLIDSRDRFEDDVGNSRFWAITSQLSPFLRTLRDDPRWAALYTGKYPVL